MNKFQPSALLFMLLGLVIALAVTGLSKLAGPLQAENQEKKAKALMQSMVSQEHKSKTLQSFELLAPNYLRMGDIQEAARLLENDKPIQVIYRSISHEGYAGPIGIMASFDQECTVKNVEILSEHETPGLGDQYKKNNKAWLKSLHGKTASSHWDLKPQGEIDSWTGATVTPRAITHALHRMQLLCVHEHDLLFSLEKMVYLEIGHPDV